MAAHSPTLPAHVASPPDHSESQRQRARPKPAKRSLVAVACLSCHKSKAKCDGARPACGRCIGRNIACEYDVEPDTTRMHSLKRKYSRVCEENEQLWELYGYLRSRQEPDLSHILKKMRENSDLSALLNFIRRGNLRQPTNYTVTDSRTAARLKTIDLDALQRSQLKVRAWPWTPVAGDGLVSELVTIFFAQEQPFIFALVDRDAFLTDMYASNPAEARFCSPLLVNIICTFACLTSPSALKYDAVLHESIRLRFFDEFRKLFERECGRATITTLQGLLIAYTYCSAAAQDRVGTLYRYAAAEMYKRLRVGTGLNSLLKGTHAPTDVRRRATISRIIWGSFFLESICEFLYLHPSLIPTPTIPRYFCEPIMAPSHQQRILDAQSDISELIYRALVYNSGLSEELGLPEDLEKRMSFYKELIKWDRTSPSKAQCEIEGPEQFYHLRAYFHVAVVAIFRPILTINCVLPNQLGTPADICISHARRIIQEAFNGLRTIPPGQSGSCIYVYWCYCCAFTIIPILNDPRTHDAFTQASYCLHMLRPLYPVALSILQGLMALAKQLNVALPEAAGPYYADIHPGQVASNDVPISYLLPNLPQVQDALAGDSGDSEKTGAELGKIISKWNALSLG